MKKFLKKYLFASLSIPVFFMPFFVQAANLVPCGTGAEPTPCNFPALMVLINRVIHFILFDLSIPLAAILFAYAGFLLITGGSSEEKRSTAKKIFTNVFFGLVIALAAWLIVETILHALGYEGAWIGF
jgi:hypothetical protein